jgi:glycosyltransferase involved in cell wall biosynthesis
VIRAVAVVVPAHNEEALLPGCLASLRQAAERAAIPVCLVVVADACTDQTARRAREAGVTVIEICARNVGAARAAGMRAVLRQMPPAGPADVWLATTDADTLVPPGWLARQLSHAEQGWDAVLGTVTVADWADRPPHAADTFAAHYSHGGGPHPHVHGANFGIRASAYLAAGGFPSLRTGEDHALLRALSAAGIAAKRAGDIAVQTSARRHARAPWGFSHLLGTLTAPA